MDTEDIDLLFIKCDYIVIFVANDAEEVGEIEKGDNVAERGGGQRSVSPFMTDLLLLL
jgi:hypothetical protein